MMSSGRRHRFVALVSAALLTTSCAALLGGLDEGVARVKDVPADGGVAQAEAAACPPWLEGFAHRVAFDVPSEVTLGGYPVRFGFDSRAAIDAGKMRSDGADLRVTGSDGYRPVPHWIESELNGEATVGWAKIDVPVGATTLFLYYGNPTAAQQSDETGTFVDGIIENERFHQGTTPWFPNGPTHGGDAGFALGDGGASLVLTAAPSEIRTACGWCQSLTAPLERSYQLVFDLEVDDQTADTAVYVWANELDGDGTVVWTRSLRQGVYRSLSSGEIAPDSKSVCLGVRADASVRDRRISARFANLRVVPYSPVDIIAGPPGPEESPCPGQ
jgi:hypothetical protein